MADAPEADAYRAALRRLKSWDHWSAREAGEIGRASTPDQCQWGHWHHFGCRASAAREVARNSQNRPLLSWPSIVLLSPVIPIWRDAIDVDAVTGSTRETRTWFGLVEIGPTIQASAVESRLKQGQIIWVANWQRVADTGYNIYGKPTSFGCGITPPIYRLGPGLSAFVTNSTDAELTQFVRTMESGTDAQKSAAVDAAGERALSGVPATRPN